MELGIGFFIGAFAGFILVGLVSLIVYVSRRVAKRRATAEYSSRWGGIDAGASARSDDRPSPKEGEAKDGRLSSGHTLVIEAMESREDLLCKNIQETRDLLLRLAEVVGSTGDASGKAAEAFTSARKAIDRIDLDKSDDLSAAQMILIKEIDRVLKTNAALQSELDRAHQGIAEQRRQIEELREAARTDGLTRVANRAAFDERMNEYVSLLDRAQIVFTLLLLDIDHFKEVNDQHGHLNGDRILRGVSTKITDNLRANDFLARYGGEEFAVILPSTSVGEAKNVAERIRQDIARTNFRLDEHTVRVTVSGGMAEAREKQSADEIIGRADQALYMSKNNGRNCIFRAE